ncbi:AAA family ATPase [Ideonella sp.]|uniref:AAA family ATPase n=1 Tax=Ideonella sp. TaxID=1929293 RepID=UPI003BB7858D
MLKPSSCSGDQALVSFYVESLLATAERAAEAQQAKQREQMIEFYARDDLHRFEDFWRMSTGEGASNARVIMKKLAQLTPFWARSLVPTDFALLAVAKKFPNFKQPIEYIRRAAALARLCAGPLNLSPMLISGQPGIGKSAFSRALAAALNVPMLSFSMTQSTASFSLGGLNAQYSSGGPGYLVRSLADLGVPDPVIVVDEIDKAATESSHDPTAPMYELLEETTAARFVDDGLQMPLNLSALRWICTCNDPGLVAEPLRSRCIEFEVPAPTRKQMGDIAAAVYRDLIAAGGWSSHFEAELPASVREELADDVPRDLARSLRNALGAAALEGRRAICCADIQVVRRPARPRVGFV